MAELMEKYGLNAAGNLARGALFCGQLCQRLQKAAVIRGGGMAFGLGQQPADFASGGAAIYLGLVAVAADTNLSGFDLGGICPGIPAQNALLRGEADNMPKDGAQLKLMLDNLNQQETAMTEMFSGKIKKEPKTFTIRLTPKEMKDEVAFRFSRKLGVVANNDLAGEPYYISVTDLKSPDVSATEEGKKKVDGVAYNLPGKAQVTLMYNNKKLFDDQLPITQFGTVEYLAPVLFNKNSTIKVLFDTATGGLIKVDRE